MYIQKEKQGHVLRAVFKVLKKSKNLMSCTNAPYRVFIYTSDSKT